MKLWDYGSKLGEQKHMVSICQHGIDHYRSSGTCCFFKPSF